jgi:hypothetical protein
VRDPNKVFGKHGIEEYRARLFLLKDSLSFFINHADDLHLFQDVGDSDLVTRMYELQEAINQPIMLIGDGEDDEDGN